MGRSDRSLVRTHRKHPKQTASLVHRLGQEERIADGGDQIECTVTGADGEKGDGRVGASGTCTLSVPHAAGGGGRRAQEGQERRLGEGKTSGGTSYIPIRAMRCGSSVLYGQCGCVQHPVVPREKRRRSYGRPSGTPTDGGGVQEERRELLRQASTLLHEADPSLTPSNKKKTSFHSQYWHSRIHDISEDELIFELQHHLEANGRIRLSDEHTKVSLLSLLALYPSLDTPVSLSELLNLRMGYTSVRFKT
ncbi:hypothetical protein OUZ56_021749 [Daphnia magna]|uniref:Uncharacterized protein n=1 Tax=Daphnia magna TaxID=35525 RepID=A0ABR0AUD0_9CRUS|nr:hypothetical protein OUZ56_021749 [Daphnia magna]